MMNHIIEDAFKEYADGRGYPEDLDSEVREELKACFFAGTGNCFSVLTKRIGGMKTHEEAQVALVDLNEQLKTYFNNEIAKIKTANTEEL